jgi:hypothetical protein
MEVVVMSPAGSGSDSGSDPGVTEGSASRVDVTRMVEMTVVVVVEVGSSSGLGTRSVDVCMSDDTVFESGTGSVGWVGSSMDVSTRVEITVKVVVEVGLSSGLESRLVDVCTSGDGGAVSVESVSVDNVGTISSVVVDVDSSTEMLVVGVG